MKKGLQFFLLLGFVTLYIALSLPINVINASEKEDTIEAKADSYVTETEKIFEETKDNPKERTSRLSKFATKTKEILSAPFTKALTKITLIQMEVVCSRMPDLESAGFSTFPQSYILLEVLGKNNVDSRQIIQALSNKRNDWKFRWLMAERIGTWGLKGAKDVMMGIILDKSEHNYLRYECLLMVPAKGKIYKGKPIGEYFIEIFRDEEEAEEIRVWATIRLGESKYKPAFDLLLRAVKEDSLKPIYALGKMGDRRALPVLFSLLKDKKYRVYVVEALGLMGGEEVIDTLINLFVNDEDSFVRYCAGIRLALSEDNRAYEVLIEHQAIIALGQAANWRRFKALDALKEIGTPGALKKLKWLSTEGSTTTSEIKERAKELLKEVEGEK